MSELVALRNERSKPEPVAPVGYRRAGSFDDPDFVPSASLQAVVGKHFARHNSKKARRYRKARGCLIQGPGGDGKSDGIRKAASDLGCDLIMQPMAEVNGATLGAGIAVLQSLAGDGRRIHAREGRPLGFLFDDVELSILAQDDRMETTVEKKLVEGWLQQELSGSGSQFVDSRDEPSALFFSANDATASGLRETLFRFGRCIFHDHVVSQAEKVIIAGRLFGGQSWVVDLVARHGDQPVAFLADLRGALFDDLLEQAIAKVGIDGAALDAALPDGLPVMDGDFVLARAAELAAARAKNFLQSGEVKELCDE